MVLESLFNPFRVKKHPWEMFAAGFIFSVVGIIMAYFVFREIAGILMVFLIVMASMPMFLSAINTEEELDLKYTQERHLLKEHSQVLTFLLFLFLGITSALVLAYLFLPADMVDTLFSLQEKAIVNVNQNIQSLITGNIAKFDYFIRIFINNLKVLFFCLVFSLLYGTGAIFILTWNASVIAAAMGIIIKTQVIGTNSLFGFSSLSSYVGAATFSFFRYMTHGIIEIAAYFIMAIAGGILSVAIIKHNLEEDQVLIDALDLVLLSLGFLVVAGLVEVYITPVLFS